MKQNPCVSILLSCYVGPTPGFLAFPKNGCFQLLLTSELKYLKWVKEISPRYLVAELLADRRCNEKSLLVEMQRNKSNELN